MADKYHIGKEGKPSVCRATKVPCPFGGEEIHFSNINEAQKASEKMMKNKYGSSFGGVELGEAQNDSVTRYGDTEIRSINSRNDEKMEKVSITAETIRKGDVISGEKFVNGKWIDDYAVVEKVDSEVSFENYKRRIIVTYENGNKAEYSGSAPITVKRSAGASQGRDRSEMRTEMKSIVKNYRNSGKLSDDDYNSVINILRDPNANGYFASYANQISFILERQGENEKAKRIIEEIDKMPNR